MYVDLSRLRDEDIYSIPIKGEIVENELKTGGRNIKFIDPIKYNGKIYKLDGDYIMTLDIIYKYEEKCARCLEPFIREDRTSLSGKLVKKTDGTLKDEDEEVIYYSDEKLDITEEVMTMIILSLPMKPLCKEDCKGICPQCGVNLNKHKCNCVVEDIDPRFAVLKDLRLKE